MPIKHLDQHRFFSGSPVFYCLVVWLCLGIVAVYDAQSAESPFNTAVVVSKKIKPYLQVSEGIAHALSNKNEKFDLFFLHSRAVDAGSELKEKLIKGKYDLVTAIGPEAAVFVWGVGVDARKMYTTVLDPGRLPGFPDKACGIPLRVPAEIQVEHIARTFDNVTRIGLLFDPGYNDWFYNQARAAGEAFSLEVIPLAVTSKDQIAQTLKAAALKKVHAVWMIPDQTVISERIVQYVIKQGIYARIGVIGYNDFFLRSGAFFSFEFDYTALGRQTGEKMLAFIETGQCVNDTPVFNTRTNLKIAEKIGIRVK